MSALRLTNESSVATGKLPPSTCKQQGSTMVTCTAPAPGINEVVFQTYPSLIALYTAYVAKVESLHLRPVQAELQRLRVPGADRTARSAGIISSSTRRPSRSAR